MIKNEWLFLKDTMSIIGDIVADKINTNILDISLNYAIKHKSNHQGNAPRCSICVKYSTGTPTCVDSIRDSLRFSFHKNHGLNQTDYTIKASHEFYETILTVEFPNRLFSCSSIYKKVETIFTTRVMIDRQITNIVNEYKNDNFLLYSKSFVQQRDIIIPGYKKLSPPQQKELQRKIKNAFKEHDVLCKVVKDSSSFLKLLQFKLSQSNIS